MLDNEKISRLTEKERALLDFSYNAEIGDVFIYESANSHKTTSIMRLAYDFYNAGLIHLVQKRIGQEISYLAIKRKRSSKKF